MELCSKLCSSLDGIGVRGRMDTCICMAESLQCSPEPITTFLISDTPIYKNKKFWKQNSTELLPLKLIHLNNSNCKYNICSIYNTNVCIYALSFKFYQNQIFWRGELLCFSKSNVRSILMKNKKPCSHHILSTPSGGAVMRTY